MKVEVVEYDPKWKKEFDKEAKILNHTLGKVIVMIHHIGSTSVPGLVAKPIIDILLEVTDLFQLETLSEKFLSLGYEVMGEFGITGRRYFRKGGENRTHHIHAFKTGDDHIIRHLAFRDYLVKHKEIADEYGKLKFRIVQEGTNDLNYYSDKKDPFIKKHEALALAWYKNLKQ